MEDIMFYVLIFLLLIIIWNLSYDDNVYRFYSDSCKYCIESKSAWDNYKKKSNKICVDVNVDNMNTKMEIMYRRYGKSVVPKILYRGIVMSLEELQKK